MSCTFGAETLRLSPWALRAGRGPSETGWGPEKEDFSAVPDETPRKLPLKLETRLEAMDIQLASGVPVLTCWKMAWVHHGFRLPLRAASSKPKYVASAPALQLDPALEHPWHPRGPQEAMYKDKTSKRFHWVSEILNKILKEFSEAAQETEREPVEKEAFEEGGSHAVPVSDEEPGAIQSAGVPVLSDPGGKPTTPGQRNLFAAAQAMAVLTFLVRLVRTLILYPQMAGYELDGAAHEHVKQREDLLSFQDRSNDCEVVEKLIGSLILIFRQLLFDSFFPMPQRPIKVGSAFEGWSPREEDIVYRMLVPLTAPRGHAFRLERTLPKRGQRGNFRVRVEPVCICMRERLGGRLLCFLHHSEEELRNQNTSLLRSFCTGSFLDVQKTACWFQKLVKTSWLVMLQSAFCPLTLLPSSRSCKFKVTTRNGKSFTMELVFGVQQGDSDVFVSSESTEGLFTPSTTWPESYAVAEAKFGYKARLLPHNSCHLKCLQLCARILPGTCFSTSTLKTVVMHLLNSTHPSNWRGMNVLLRMQEIMRYLHHCLEEKRLDPFFIGNENMTELASVPLPTREAEPLNLFQHLAQDPAAHAKALREFMDLRDRLIRLLFYGH
ncbi:LOW QUALITY PROTEIN: inositol 1,4,5-trisphosphate receptor-interacting protein-like 1 [Pterocles gutturalis]